MKLKIKSVTLSEQEAKDLRAMFNSLKNINMRYQTKEGQVAIGQGSIAYYQETADRFLTTIENQLGA